MAHGRGRPATAQEKRRGLWQDALLADTSMDELGAARLSLAESWRPGAGASPRRMAGCCWAFLTARDPENNQPLIWTVDEANEIDPVRPFPAQEEYLREVVYELWGPQRELYIDKVRQKYVSTICCLALWWYGAHVEEREIIVSKLKEEAAVKLINDKIRTPWRRLPPWAQQLLPMTAEPARIITFPKTGSTITAVAQNFAEGDGRGVTGSVVLVDEAAYQDAFRGIRQAILPMRGRIWAVTTPNIGNDGAAHFKELVFEGRPKTAIGELEEVSVEESEARE